MRNDPSDPRELSPDEIEWENAQDEYNRELWMREALESMKVRVNWDYIHESPMTRFVKQENLTVKEDDTKGEQ